jgi:transcription antitermination factor NusG
VQVDVDLPLFPCYLFARASIHDRIRLLQQPGVLGFAASSARPTVIPDEEISVLRTATESLKAEPHPYLNNGDTVRIVAGPLVGMTGILARRKQEYRVVLSIEAIMRSIVVEVSEFDIEPQEKKR